MRVTRPIISFVICSFCLVPLLTGQSTSTASSTQAATVLQSAITALTGKTAIADATLTGTVEWIAGSEDETGTATYKGLTGTYRLDMVFRNGTRSEIVSPVSGVPAGNWIGLDGVSHAIANHNLMVDVGWFPAFALTSLISSSNTVLSYVGQETRNDMSVIHVSAIQISPNFAGSSSSLMQHLTQVDLYLDPTTFLPVSYVFNVHPDNNALLDIPVEIRYSNYQSVNGAQIPLHVEKYLNNTLAIDLQFQSPALNTGLTASQISGQ